MRNCKSWTINSTRDDKYNSLLLERKKKFSPTDLFIMAAVQLSLTGQ